MSAIENILGMLPDRVGDGKNSQIYTPPHIAKEMVNTLPEDIWNKDTTFLDICCKSGIFLYKIYQKLMESPSMQADFPDEINRAKHIIHKQLFGIAPSTFCQMFSTRTVYGYLDPESNIISINEYELVMRNADKTFLYKTLQKEFNTVKFDVVIGNPPYNNDAYLDFVTLGHQLSNKYTMMITPAKWQAKGGAKNEAFRKDIVPYIKDITYYPEATDIFDIAESDGISYYLIGKEKGSSVSITNKSDDIIIFNNRQTYDTKNLTTISLLNVANTIIKKLNNIPKINVMTNGKHKYFVAEARMYGWGTERVKNGNRYHSCKCYTNELKYNVISIPQVVEAKDINSLAKVRTLTFSCDSLDKCKSYVSFMESKLVKFLMLSARIGTMVGGEAKRFVPAPEAFDHIFTDAELYEKYNLTQEEINIIESVIKERK